MALPSETFDDAIKLEMIAALDPIEQQIRGLDDKLRVSLSNESLGAIRSVDDERKMLRGVLTQVIAAHDALRRALDNLRASGYPKLPKLEVSAAVFQELQGQRADEAAADAQFQPAVSASIVFGPTTIEDKPSA